MPEAITYGREEEDSSLVTAVVKGDNNAFRRLVTRYEKLVVGIVYKMIARKEDCEDLCQDVFLKVYERIGTFRFQSKLSTWIGSIAFNTCVNFLQKRKQLLLEDLRKPKSDDDEPASHIEMTFQDIGTAADERIISKEREQVLLKSIEELSVIQKTVLYLFHQMDLSLQEISELTDLPTSTVKSHLFRARKKLREQMNKY